MPDSTATGTAEAPANPERPADDDHPDADDVRPLTPPEGVNPSPPVLPAVTRLHPVPPVPVPPKQDAPAVESDHVSLPWLGEPRPLPGTGAHAVPPVGWGFRSALAVGEFPRTGWGHRGYDEQAVDDFVERVGHELAAADDQIGDLRAEVDRLHRYIRRQWAAVAAAEAGRGQPPGAPAPSAQARSMLTQAQELAERRLAEVGDRLAESERIAQARLAAARREVAERLQEADELATRRIREAELSAGRQLQRVEDRAEQLLADAEREAARRRLTAEEDHHRLLDRARTGYEDIVRRAHRRADQAAETALADLRAEDPPAEEAALEAQAAYLRTFAKATRSALEMALAISATEFERLVGAAAGRESGPPVRRARVIALPTVPEDTRMTGTN